MIEPRWINMRGIEYQANELRLAVKNKLGSDSEFGFDNEIYLDYMLSKELLSDFEFTSKEGLSEEILGKYEVFSNKIWIYDGIAHKGRENFTVFHEMGHCILHRTSLLDYFRKNSTEIKDQQFSIELHRDNVNGKVKRDGKKINLIEMQANQFARYLLMPRDPFIEHFYKLMKALNLSTDSFKYMSYIDKNIGNRYIESMRAYYIITKELSKIFQTSRGACGVQLKNLGYLDKKFEISS